MSLEAHPHPRALDPLLLLIAAQAFISPGPSPADVWCHLLENNPEGVNLPQIGIALLSVLGLLSPCFSFQAIGESSAASHNRQENCVFSHQNRDLPLVYLLPPVYYVTAELFSDVKCASRLEETKL